MNYQHPIGSYTLLLLQHKPSLATAVKKAVSPLGCKVSIAGDAKDLVELYSSSIHNPFGIFGQSGFNCILLDFSNDPGKSGKILNDFRQLFPSLPPVIGVFAKGDGLQAAKYQKSGVDDVLYIPDTIQNINASLKKYIYPVNGALNQNLTKIRLGKKIEEFPVINPKTLSLLNEMAVLQNFPIQSLMDSFIDEMGSFIAVLLVNFEKEKFTECLQSTASLKSLCKTLGASQVVFLTSLLEKALMESNMQTANKILQHLVDRFFALRDFIETYKSNAG
ncbi:MAG TPA: response regulator [Bacteroidales bacterium]|nr:response regulator [Bacteroidales bacterium]